MQTNMQARGTTTLALSRMTCDGCARTIERVLSRVPGVTSAKADFGCGAATVSGTAAPSDLVAAVEAAGYGASVATNASREQK